MARSQPFKMRLLDDEVADLDARAEREGIAKADVIRRAMGWEAVNLVKPPSPIAATSPSPDPSPRRPSPSAEKEPGVAAASELARRIKERREGGGGG